MALTPLTLYGSEVLATTLPNAGTLLTTGGGSSNSTQSSLLGTATGWGELCGHSQGAAWAAAGSAPAQSGHGYLFDSPALETMQFPAGTWTRVIKLSLSAGTATVDVMFRASIYHGWNNTYTTIGSVTVTGNALTTGNTTITLNLALPFLILGVGDKLYFDMPANVTANSTGSGAATIGTHDFAHSSSLGLATNEFVTPGYQSQMAVAVNAPLGLPYAGSQQGGPYIQSKGGALWYNGKPLNFLYGSTFYLNVEGGSPLWRTNIQSLLLSIVQTYTASDLVLLRPTDQWGNVTSGLNWDDPTIWSNMDYLVEQAYLAGQWVLIDISGWEQVLSFYGCNIQDATLWYPFIAAVGAHYRYTPNVAWFSVVGEPATPTTSGMVVTLTAFYDQVTTAMHAAAPNHLVTAGGFINMNNGYRTPPWYQGIWQLPHNDVCSLKSYSSSDRDDEPIYGQYAQSIGKPSINEEFGAEQVIGDGVYSGTPWNGVATDRVDYYTAIYNNALANGVSGAIFWNYDHGVGATGYDVDPIISPALWETILGYTEVAPAPFIPTPLPVTSIAPATILTLSDAVAAHIAGLVTFAGNSQSAIMAGQATTLGRIAALNDQMQQYALLDGCEAAMLAESAYLANFASYAAILDLLAPACMALDDATGGIAAYLALNALQVQPAFADACNRAASHEWRERMPIATWQILGNTIAQMAQIVLTAANTGNVTLSTMSSYGNAPLSIVNAGSGTTGSAAATYTVSYQKYDPHTGVVTTPRAATATMPASSAPGTTIPLVDTGNAQVSGIAILGITVSGGTSGDTISVASALARSPAY